MGNVPDVLYRYKAIDENGHTLEFFVCWYCKRIQ